MPHQAIAAYPFLPASELAVVYRQQAEELSKDVNNLLPPWARPEASQLFRKRKLIICGSVCSPEIRVLAKYADVFGIVDDFNFGRKMFGIPVVNSDTWIRWAKKDKSIVSCVLTPKSNGYRYFVRQCIQWELPYLSPLHVLHLIRTHGISTIGELGGFFWYGYDFFDYAVKNQEKLSKLASHLEDEFSRFSWFSMLMYRLTFNPFYRESCAVGRHEDYYGLDSYAVCRQFMKFSDQEIYTDAGAFTGDTIEGFLRAVSGKFKHIYSFEPSAANNRQIRSRLQKLQSLYLDSFGKKISLIEKGLWDSDTVLRFNAAEAGDIQAASAYVVESKILENIYDPNVEKKVVTEIPVTTIDNATNQDSTFIKFEIEGSELQALHGSAKTIEHNRPQMAVSIYHKPDDYVTLTEFVLDTRLDYKMGFRHHNTCDPAATVLYCHH